MWLKHRLPLSSYLMLLSKRGAPKTSGFSSVIAGGLRLSLRYRMVKIWTVSAKQVLKLRRQNLLPFVPLMKGGGDELENGARKLSEVADELERRELSLHFLLLGGLRYNKSDLLELITRETMIPIEQLRESSFYQYIVEEGMKEGAEKGLQKGLQKGLKRGLKKGLEKGLKEGLETGLQRGIRQGRREGKKEGEATLLKRQVRARFGRLPKWAVARIDAADTSSLENWGVRLLTARSLKDALR